MGLLDCGTEHCRFKTGHAGPCVTKTGGFIPTVHNERSPEATPLSEGLYQEWGKREQAMLDAEQRLKGLQPIRRTVLHDSFDETVNHPIRYNSHPSGIECIAIIEHMPFNIGSAIKYLWRAGLKENAPTEQDFDKAIWCIQREKLRLKNVKP